MILIDSNIIIYSLLTQYEYLADLFNEENTFVSEVSKLEVLGYHKLKSTDETYFKNIFNFVPSILPTQEIFNVALELKKTHTVQLGDSLIAATALVHNLYIYSRDVKDFNKLKGLKCINPIK
jgi:predicted nucleic acid-binding protein